jgi:hypothetical protein
MRGLLAAGHRAAARGAQLRLAIPPGTIVRRLADLLGLDRRVPVYPSPGEAAAGQPAGTTPALPTPRQGIVTMADIIDVIAASRTHIARWQATVSDLAGQGSDPGSRQRQAVAWDTLARLTTLHLAAEDEICLPAVCQAAPHGQARARAMLDEHEDIRELIREACLQPPGSPPWQQLTAATRTAWAEQDNHAAGDILDALHHAGPARRQQLARQWHAFTDARERDEDEAARAASTTPGRTTRPIRSLSATSRDREAV